MNAMYSDDADTYFSYTLTDDIILNLKRDNRYDSLVEDWLNRKIESDIVSKFGGIVSYAELSSTTLRAAENYFKDNRSYEYDLDDIKIKKGYTITYTQISTSGDITNQYKFSCLAFDVKGDGWKFITNYDSLNLEKDYGKK